MSLKRRIVAGARRTGMLRMIGSAWGRRRLTVLAYHRVVDHGAPGFDTHLGTVSATPAGFADQLDLIAERYTVIPMDRLLAWLAGATDLPERPALITFDDGYADNFTHAFPALQARGLPATVFLATDHVGTGRPFWWDRIAHAFAHTSATGADLPALGPRSWGTPVERRSVEAELIGALKAVADHEKEDHAASVPDLLGVPQGPGTFAGLHLTWDQVRVMEDAGFTAAAHTCRHPILTRVGGDRARREVLESVSRVAEEVGRPVRAFAYPNGLPEDIDEGVLAAVTEAGVAAGFTLSPGPARAAEAARDPRRIRRVYVDRAHTLADLEHRLAGLVRLSRGLRERRVRLRSPGAP